VSVSLGGSGELELKLPPASKQVSIADPASLMKHVAGAWDSVVAPHQAGLTDPKAGPMSGGALAPEEAWHHYTAGQQGVIDSARFLVAFNVSTTRRRRHRRCPRAFPEAPENRWCRRCSAAEAASCTPPRRGGWWSGSSLSSMQTRRRRRTGDR